MAQGEQEGAGRACKRQEEVEVSSHRLRLEECRQRSVIETNHHPPAERPTRHGRRMILSVLKPLQLADVTRSALMEAGETTRNVH